MGLYLAIFDGDEEVDGIDVGSYSDFGTLRDAVISNLEPEGAGSRFPTLILHSDCDGEWTPEEAVSLVHELEVVGASFRAMPPSLSSGSDWQTELRKNLELYPSTLYECFIDVDGDLLIDGMLRLARLSVERELPILFQ
jgi:hypothetical protein